MYEDIKDIELTEKGEVDHRGDVNVDTLESITANVGSEDDARIADSIDDILCELGVREEERAT